MKQTDKLFQITLPKAIALLRVQFEFVMENDDKFAPFVAEVCDDGGGAYLKLNMPKDAARIFLEVVNVYPQRLYDISEAEATAEGVSPLKGETARDAFLRLWIDLYGPPKHGSRVWAIEFKVREVRP